MLVKNLSVKVTYQLDFGNLDLSEEIVDQLKDEFSTDLMSMKDICKYSDAINWLIDNCNEADASETNFEITYIDE